MIKIENVGLASPEQMEFIIEGMRNPMNSWEKSDSGECNPIDRCYYSCNNVGCEPEDHFHLGENDHSLMQRLSDAGTEHRKYMRMMPVYVKLQRRCIGGKNLIRIRSVQPRTVHRQCTNLRQHLLLPSVLKLTITIQILIMTHKTW